MSNVSKITSLTNISVPATHNADIYIKKILYEGNPEDSKRPIAMMCGFEESKQIFKLVTWDFKLLDIIKTAFNEKKICTITFLTTEYKDGLSHKLQSITVTDKETSYKEPEKVNDIKFDKELYENLINQVSDLDFKTLLKTFILNNDNFFKWPAAKTIHHAFEGGLAKHSYNVAVNAINLANNYNQEIEIDYDLLITGALLHDIGKLQEYTNNGTLTILGQMISHLVLGVEMIDDVCDKCGLDKTNSKFIKLKHIIVSHHGKLEHGSPNMPMIPEAYIIAFCDNNDASIESMIEHFELLNVGDISGPIIALDGGRLGRVI